MSHSSRILWSIAASSLLLFTLGEANAEEWDVEPAWEVHEPTSIDERLESADEGDQERVFRQELRPGDAQAEELDEGAGALSPIDEIQASRGLEEIIESEDDDSESGLDDEEVDDSDIHPTSLPTGEDRSAVTPQALSLPTGGGTIEGMGESFRPLLSSGQATFSVPIALPGGRAGTGASLGLGYSTGGGNSMAGIGWSFGVPFIARQTDRGMPRYETGSLDRFIYNGGSELVPIASSGESMPEGEAWPSFVETSSHEWLYFRARIEGSFMRFFMRVDEQQWVVQDTSGTLFFFGHNGSGTGASVFEFVDDGVSYTYRWNLSSVVDTSGNRVEYRYFREDGQSYLQHVYWNNPPGGATDDDLASYQHHVVMEYEERPDPYFSYSSGFRIETAYRLWRVVVESVPYGLPPGSDRTHTRTYVLTYDPDSALSLLTGFQMHGRGCFDADSPGCSIEEGGSLPGLTFEYSGLDSGVATAGFGYINDEYEEVLISPPNSVSEARSDLLDANSDGLPDLLVTDPAHHSGGHGLYIGRMDADRRVYFEPADDITCQRPDGGGTCEPVSGELTLSNPNVNPLDADGDGRVEYLHMPHLLDYQYYRLVDDDRATPLTGYVWEQVGDFEPGDPDIDFSRDAEHIRVVDVNNDHLVDVVRTAGSQIQTFLNLGRCPDGDGRFGTPSYDTWGSCIGFDDAPITSCALYRGLPLDFSDEELRLADMNGDGLRDIVHLRRGDVAYWPGRGPGVWGVGSRSCEPGTYGDDREMVMADGPLFGFGGDGLHLADVNADGTADLIQVRFSDVDIWLNYGGYGWSERYTIADTPPHPGFENRIRLADLNGSGSRDIVWGDADHYRYLDLNGGQRPRLLTVVHNGLGGETEILYRSSVDYMVDDELAGNPWTDTSPMPMTVVAGTISRDGLGAEYYTEYEYRDAVYDGLEAEFRGFRRALARAHGDEHAPTEVTLNWFHTGDRPEWLCAESGSRHDCSLRDNPHEPLRGKEYRSERRSDPDPLADPWASASADYLGTTLAMFTIEQLIEGRDGRGVWLAWSPQGDSWSYNHDPGFQPGSHVVTDYSLINTSILDETGASSAMPATLHTVVLRTEADNFAHVRTTRDIDRFGHLLWESAEGFVDIPGDEVVRQTRWAINPSSWIHRPCQAWVEGEVEPDGSGDASERLGWTQTFYDGLNAVDDLCTVGDRGLPTFERVNLVRRQLDGAPMAADSWLPGAITVYNAQGLVTETWGGVEPSLGFEDQALQYAEREYDAQYGAAVVRERIQANRPGDDDDLYLETEATWDTNFGALVSLRDFNGRWSHVLRDSVGRTVATYRPLCAEPSVVHDYHIDPASALHYVHTRVNEICDSVGDPAAPDETTDPFGQLQTATGVQEAYAFTDGMGRVRATISEDDNVGDWILSGVSELDARGNAWRAYQPLRISGDPVAEVRISGLPTDFSEVQRDAFGRQVWATAIGDGRRINETFFGSYWTRAYDGNDLYEPGHRDTPNVTVVDGLGREVLAVAHRSVDDPSSVLMASMSYDVMGNVLAITRGEGAVDGGRYTEATFVTGHTTTRALLYDSLGRRTHNIDADSGNSFYYYDRFGSLTRFVDARGAESRFLYDMAGRLIVEDHGFVGADGASWASPDGTTGHSADDDPSLGRQENLLLELWHGYIADDDGDFLPQAGADVLYGFDREYALEDIAPCQTAPTASQLNTLGSLAWVRDQAGCSWTSYDGRGRPTWGARQIDPDPRVFESESAYVDESGLMDDLDRVREATYPDGTSLRYTFNERGLLDRVVGDAPTTDSLFYNRVFVDDVSYDELGAREWIRVGAPGENQVTTTYRRDHRRRMSELTSVLHEHASGDDQTIIDNEYHFDEVGNIVSVRDHRRIATRSWSPISVDYEYEYDPLYQLVRATPSYATGSRPGDDPGTPEDDEERPGEQRWSHDYLGSMRTWSAVEDVAGEHFYDWSLGTIVNGQQLIEAGNLSGVSSRCALDHGATAGERTAGPAPHALYFAYQPTGTGDEYEAMEACYDEAGNMVGLYRLLLEGCDTDPLNESTAAWSGCTQTVQWQLDLTWDAVGRLADVVKTDYVGTEDAHLRHVYDSSNSRVIRLDLDTSEGDDKATLYVAGGYEIRNAAIVPTGYSGGEETKFVFDGPNRLARIVEGNSALLDWNDDPVTQRYVVYTLTNHLGSAAVTIHANPPTGEDSIVAAQTQLAYGVEDDAVESADHDGWRPDYEFTGKEQDPDVGLMYFGARFYAPGLGRWVSADPLAVHGLGADLSAYRYVNANPLLLIDPNGLLYTESECVSDDQASGTDFVESLIAEDNAIAAELDCEFGGSIETVLVGEGDEAPARSASERRSGAAPRRRAPHNSPPNTISMNAPVAPRGQQWSEPDVHENSRIATERGAIRAVMETGAATALPFGALGGAAAVTLWLSTDSVVDAHGGRYNRSSKSFDPVRIQGEERQAQNATGLLIQLSQLAAGATFGSVLKVGGAARHGDFHGPFRPDRQGYNWGDYLRQISGTSPPSGMFRAHAHHILPRNGLGATQRALVQEGQQILRHRAGIDPIWGIDNMTWATNGRGVHTTAGIRRVVQSLRELDASNGTPEQFRALLQQLGSEAAAR